MLKTSSEKSYKIITKNILDKINEGVYAPGQSIESFRAIARQTGTSNPSVYRALTELVQSGYLKKTADRGYVVAAQRPIDLQPSNRTVGILLSIPTPGAVERMSPFFSAIIEPLQAGLIRQERFSMILGWWTDSQHKAVHFPPAMLAESHLDGLFTVELFDLWYMAELKVVQPRLVALDVDATGVGVDSVAFDNLGSAAEIVRRLAVRGARRIAFIGGPLSGPKVATLRTPYANLFDPCAQERFNGWRAGMLGAGLDPAADLVALVPHRDTQHVAAAVTRLLAKQPWPDAIVAEDPFAVRQALRAADGLAAKIPVAGWADSTSAASLRADIDLLAMLDVQRLGVAGLELMARRRQNPGGEVERCLLAPAIQEQKPV